jgi:hypothetical protein
LGHARFVITKASAGTGETPSQFSTIRVQPNILASASAWRLFPLPCGAETITGLLPATEGIFAMTRLTDFRGVYFPYCLHKEGDGWVVLNRLYKPVGQLSDQHANYPDFAVPLKISKALAVKMQHDGQPEPDRIYLYDDASSPVRSKANWEAYADRLRLLAKLEMKL